MHPRHFFRTENTPHFFHFFLKQALNAANRQPRQSLKQTLLFLFSLIVSSSSRSLPVPSSSNGTTQGEEHLSRSHASQTMSVFAHTHLSMRKNAETSQQSPIVLLQPSRWLEQLPIHRGGVASAHPVHRQRISGSPRVRSFVESTLAFLFPIS